MSTGDRIEAERRERLFWAAYPIGLLLILIPSVEVVSRTWPLEFGQMAWRFGTFGIVYNTLMTPLLGLLVCVVAAAFLRHRGLQTLLSWTSMVAAILLWASAALFILDALQLRALTENPESSFAAMTIRALGAALGIGVAMFIVGVQGLRARTPRVKKARRRRRGKSRAPVGAATRVLA